MYLLTYDKQHETALRKTGKTLTEVLLMSEQDKAQFLSVHFPEGLIDINASIGFVSGVRNEVIHMITYWKIGQTQEWVDDWTEDGFLKLVAPLPACNHNFSNLSPKNLSFARGTILDGTPFEADLWFHKKAIWMSVYLIEKREFKPSTFGERLRTQAGSAYEELTNPDEAEITRMQQQAKRPPLPFGSALCHGMVPSDRKCDALETNNYLRYLEYNGLVAFTDHTRNGAVSFFVDHDGMTVACVCIMMGTEQNISMVETAIEFQPFPQTHCTNMRDTRIQEYIDRALSHMVDGVTDVFDEAILDMIRNDRPLTRENIESLEVLL